MTRIARAIQEACDEVKRDVWIDPWNVTAEDLNNGLCAEVMDAIVKRIPEAEKCDSDFAAHFFVRYRGRYYDAEAPNGVDHPNQLPIFRRSFAGQRKNG